MRSRVCMTMSLALIFLSVPAAGKSGDGPRYIEPPSSVPRPVDRTFDGVIDVHVDATDVQRRIFSVRQRIPIGNGGRVTLLYPRWEAASHGPSLSVTDLAGLAVEAADRPLPWRRDPYELHAFHVDVPAGTAAIDVRFQMVAGTTLLTPDVVSVPWQRLILYPAGWYARNIGVTPTLTLPSAMRALTTLKVERSESATIRFPRTTLDTLSTLRCWRAATRRRCRLPQRVRARYRSIS